MTEPLTPADCDLRDFPFIQMDVQRLLSSETWVLGTADEKAAAITLWLACWHQVPAASVPNNDRMLAHLSMAGPKWGKVKAHALRGWVDGGDGRLYHPVVAEKALAAWIEKLSNSIAGANGNAKRWGTTANTTDQEAALCDAIERLKSIAPASPCLKKKVAATVKKTSTPDRVPTPKSSPPDRKREGEGEREIQIPAHAPVFAARPSDEPKLRPTKAGAACVAMRASGLADCNPSHPDLLALVDAGAGVDVFAEAAQTAVARGKGFAYVLGMVKGQMADAAQTAAKGLKPSARNAPKSFAQQEREAGWARWEEMTGRPHPDRLQNDHMTIDIDTTGARHELAIQGH